MDGKDLDETWLKVKRDFPVLMTAELGFWPFFNFVVFKKVPIPLQASCVCFGTIFWAFILSTIEMRVIKEQKDGGAVYLEDGGSD